MVSKRIQPRQHKDNGEACQQPRPHACSSLGKSPKGPGPDVNEAPLKMSGLLLPARKVAS